MIMKLTVCNVNIGINCIWLCLITQVTLSCWCLIIMLCYATIQSTMLADYWTIKQIRGSNTIILYNTVSIKF